MANIVKAELYKIWTSKIWWIFLSLSIVLQTTTIIYRINFMTPDAIVTDSDTINAKTVEISGFDKINYISGTDILSAAFDWSHVLAIILGVLLMSSEFRHRVIDRSVLSVNKRWKFACAKMFSGSIFATILSSVNIVYCLIAFGIIRSIQKTPSGFPQVPVSAKNTIFAYLYGTSSTIIFLIIGMAIALIFSNQIFSVFTVLGILLIRTGMNTILPSLPDETRVSLLKISPFLPTIIHRNLLEGQTIYFPNPDGVILPLPAALGLLVVYGIILLIPGIYILKRRNLN